MRANPKDNIAAKVAAAINARTIIPQEEMTRDEFFDAVGMTRRNEIGIVQMRLAADGSPWRIRYSTRLHQGRRIGVVLVHPKIQR